MNLLLLILGQFVTGRKKASTELKIKESSVYNYLQILKSMKNIYITPNNKYSLITIVNWEEYQINPYKIDNKIDNKLTANKHIQENKEFILYFINKYKGQNLRFYQKLSFLRRIKSDERYSELSQEQKDELREYVLEN